MHRHTYSVLSIARRHPQLFSELAAAGWLQFWPTKTDGTHLVVVYPDGTVHQVGVLWGVA
jgi:hypothetical protein